MSNRLTFSLASLVFLIAFGLVFGTTSVMAHTDADRDTNGDGDLTDFAADGDIGTHTHPVKAAIPHTTPSQGVPGVLRVPIHNAHPTVKSVALKAGTTVKGNMVAVDATTNTTFVLVVTFSGSVVNTDNVTKAAADANITNNYLDGDLGSGELAHSTANVDNTAAGGDTSFDISRPGTGNAKSKNTFHVEVTPGSYPSGTAGANDKELKFRIQINDGAVFGFQTSEIVGLTPTNISGGPNSTSDIYTFTLVNDIPDTTSPRMRITTPDKAEANGDVVFTIDVDKALGEGPNALQASDFTIDGGTGVLAEVDPLPKNITKIGSGANAKDVVERYTLTVTPTQTSNVAVTVTLNPDSVADALGNAITTVTATYDKTPPTVTITPPAAPDDDGKLLFTFEFSEPLNNAGFPVSAIDRSGSDNVRLLDGAPKLAADSVPATPTYELLVTPADSTRDTTVLLLIGSVKDKAGNGLASDVQATYKVPVTNTPPVFVAWDAPGLTWCEGVTLGDTEVVLPKARDSEGDSLTYTLTGGGDVSSADRANPVKPPDMGLYWVTIDSETRYLRGYTAVGDAGTYTWTVTDEHGASNVTPLTFTITVDPYEEPNAVTGVMATKVDATATVGDDVDKVKLTWTDPNPTTYPNDDCIPAVTHYIISRQALNTHTQGRTPKGAVETTTLTVAQATNDDGDLEYITDKLDHGTYEFTVQARNHVTRPDKTTYTGTSDASDEAIWDKTNYHWVIVNDAPMASTNLRANQTDSPRDSVTLDWIPPTHNPDAPVNDGAEGMAMALYGVETTFGGYHLEVTNQTTAAITIYPKDGSLVAGDARTYRISDLQVGEYTVRVVASNVVGKGALSNSQDFEIDVYQPDPTDPPDPTNKAPDFGNATIARITATVGQPIAGRFLPEATDADGDTLTYSIEDGDGETTTSPGGLTFNATNRSLTGTPTAVMAETAYTYKVTDGTDSDTIGFFIIVKKAGPDPTPPPTAATSLAAGGYVVFVRSLANAPNFGMSTPAVAEWAEMPNLYELFNESGGGSLQLNVTGVNARQVVFSEVMWAVDEGKVGQDSYDGQQWIEVHNRTTSAVAISSISFAMKKGRPALPQGTDLISNVVGAGNDWIKNGKGQNGNSGAADGSGQVEFRSMYRNNYGEAGWDAGRWSESTLAYHPNYKGTPGRKEPAGPKVVGTDTVPRSPIIFNEISNNTNPDHEWIELRNVSGGNVNLKNYEVTMLTSKGANQDSHNDVDLIDFTTADRNVPAGGILLVVKKDPTGDPSHPLAAGWNFGARNTWTVAEPGQANYVPGVNADSPRYMVAHAFGNIPDDGNFVLVLRNRQDRNGSTGDGNIRDIAGYVPDNGLKVENANTFTHLWPLSNFAAPSWSNNNLAAGTVQRRQYADTDGTKSKDKNQNDKAAFRDDDNGWTGIGYKRNAAATAQNGGTPGYAHGVLHSNDDLANGAVIISEIMPTKGDRNLPEWIELRNTSSTIGVNVDNWRLTITNHDSDGAGGSFDGVLSHTINISGRIPPGQTYLIVARSGRNTTNLPSERVHNVGRTRNQFLLNPYGFEIKLESKKDNNYLHVDTVGNLGESDGRRSRSFADVAWDMPATTDESGDRISIVRSPLNGMPMGGTIEGAWKSFEDTDQPGLTDQATYYGHQNDFGSPGHTAGGVLPVSLSKFRPERLATGEVAVRWVTESETNNAGFNILRGEALDGVFTKLNTQLIKGQGTTSERTAYEFVDKTAKPNVVYYYQIQDVSLDGEVVTLKTTHMRGNISVVGKLTTTWGELKALQ